jgi:glycine/D-amino acid oxidase-like deaminating enzyme
MQKFLIVGQGLAGSVLALQLLEQGADVTVAEYKTTNRSSWQAAGLFNPITGRKLTKTWLADLLFPQLHKSYSRWEQLLETKFFHPTPILVPFSSAEKQNDWVGHSAEPAFADFISDFVSDNPYPDQISAAFGAMRLQQCGYVDLPAFLTSVRNYLKEKELLVWEQIDFQEIEPTATGVCWKRNDFTAVVWANGLQAVEHPLFTGMDFRPVKGEWLEVELPQQLPEIVNRGCWVLPTTAGATKVGATYDRNLAAGTTTAAREELEQRLQSLLVTSYEVREQHWGIRPATYNRRPFVGQHPQHPQHYLFNGLGAKGVSLAPYFGAQLVEQLLGGEEVRKEVQLARAWR